MLIAVAVGKHLPTQNYNRIKLRSRVSVVSFAVVFGVVTQRSSGALSDDPKNGYEGD